jgi:hypothetical protein
MFVKFSELLQDSSALCLCVISEEEAWLNMQGNLSWKSCQTAFTTLIEVADKETATSCLAV